MNSDASRIEHHRHILVRKNLLISNRYVFIKSGLGKKGVGEPLAKFK